MPYSRSARLSRESYARFLRYSVIGLGLAVVGFGLGWPNLALPKGGYRSGRVGERRGHHEADRREVPSGGKSWTAIIDSGGMAISVFQEDAAQHNAAAPGHQGDARRTELGFQGELPRIENFESFEGQVHI